MTAAWTAWAARAKPRATRHISWRMPGFNAKKRQKFQAAKIHQERTFRAKYLFISRSKRFSQPCLFMVLRVAWRTNQGAPLAMLQAPQLRYVPHYPMCFNMSRTSSAKLSARLRAPGIFKPPRLLRVALPLGVIPCSNTSQMFDKVCLASITLSNLSKRKY